MSTYRIYVDSRDRQSRTAEDFTYAFPCHFSQNKLNTVLHNILQSDESDIRFNSKYISHKQVGEKVYVKANLDNGSSCEIECDALVGTDGVRSRVREVMGIKVSGQKSK